MLRCQDEVNLGGWEKKELDGVLFFICGGANDTF